ncbi:MAG: hypothetical protein CSA53_03330 [Gammaproteobacteria bacterium]|nr:MAG: hypothetical protein CSA53_03330 [Gammaproteobacteria bacterium]
MSAAKPRYTLASDTQGHRLTLSGDWTLTTTVPDFGALKGELTAQSVQQLQIACDTLQNWDSTLLAWLLKLHRHCLQQDIALNSAGLPEGAVALLDIATTVPPYQPPEPPPKTLWQRINPAHRVIELWHHITAFIAFIGAVAVALWRLLTGKAKTRLVDFLGFVYQAGPNAFGIISLVSLLVGMILAYLGAVQLKQLGAEIYVADLVTIGALREMGVLMTAVVMAGRTGAAYAAQLGTMQTNEEIDAITTLGISPIEFLVLPRMLALICIMPLLTLYADILCILGGAIVAVGMNLSPMQYFSQAQLAITAPHILVGLIKALVFGGLIAIAGCRAGMQSGRSSAAVGQAATNAVVTSVVYLIVADATINIICQQLDF